MTRRPKSAAPGNSKWNGDEIRPDESQGFDKARATKGLTTVEGTRAPSVDPNVKPQREIKFVPATWVPMKVARLGVDNGQTK